MADIDGFVETYVDEEAWKDGRDAETCRTNARKYAVSLRGTPHRLGFFDWLSQERGKEPEEATDTDVGRFLRYLQKQGLAASTRTQARSGISKYYQLMDPSGSARNPVEELDASWSVTTDKERATGSERHYLSKENVRALIENVPEPTLRNELLVKLLYQTGLRRTELAKVELDKVDLDEREIQVYGEKASEWRTVAFRESLRGPLNIWIDTLRRDEAGYHENNSYLFPAPSERGEKGHIAGRTVGDIVVRSAENAGIQETYNIDATGADRHKITAHTLRHTFAVHSAENDVPAPHLKEALGHHSLDITQIYLDIAGSDAVEMMKDRAPSL